MNLANCHTLPRISEKGTWFRCIQTAFLRTALNTAHTKNNLARFNPAVHLPVHLRFATLSLADDPTVAMLEIGAVLGKLSPGRHLPHPRMTTTTLNVVVDLKIIVDLTDVSGCQSLLDTNPQELTGDWEGYVTRSALTPISHPMGIAPTQELGQALFGQGVDGFMSLSAKVAHQKTLTIFPDNFPKNGSSAIFYDPSGAVVHRLP